MRSIYGRDQRKFPKIFQYSWIHLVSGNFCQGLFKNTVKTNQSMLSTSSIRSAIFRFERTIARSHSTDQSASTSGCTTIPTILSKRHSLSISILTTSISRFKLQMTRWMWQLMWISWQSVISILTTPRLAKLIWNCCQNYSMKASIWAYRSWTSIFRK